MHASQEIAARRPLVPDAISGNSATSLISGPCFETIHVGGFRDETQRSQQHLYYFGTRSPPGTSIEGSFIRKSVWRYFCRLHPLDDLLRCRGISFGLGQVQVEILQVPKSDQPWAVNLSPKR